MSAVADDRRGDGRAIALRPDTHGRDAALQGDGAAHDGCAVARGHHQERVRVGGRPCEPSQTCGAYIGCWRAPRTVTGPHVSRSAHA